MVATSNTDQHQSATKLLESQTQVWHQVFTFISSMALKCATELGIADIIHKHGRPMSLDELVAALNINKDKSNGIYRLMRVLINSGFFTFNEEQGGGYDLTLSSLVLVENHPFSVKSFVSFQLDPVFVEPFSQLGQWFRTDDADAIQTTFGTSIWEIKESDSRLSRVFDSGMATDTPFMSTCLTSKECEEIFKGLDSIVDVGGGTGTLAKAIVKTFPNIDCTVLDLPHVVAGQEGSVSIKYVGGDMFNHIPPADAIVMKWILHDWSDEKSIEILNKCREAVTTNKEKRGKIIIIDMVVDEHIPIPNAYETQLYFDMMMMASNGGKERTEKEWSRLFFDAGFSNYKITRLSGIKSFIEVFP